MDSNMPKSHLIIHKLTKEKEIFNSFKEQTQPAQSERKFDRKEYIDS